VPIVNTLAFLFTVVGEWWVENRVISRSKCLFSLYNFNNNNNNDNNERLERLTTIWARKTLELEWCCR